MPSSVPIRVGAPVDFGSPVASSAYAPREFIKEDAPNTSTTPRTILYSGAIYKFLYHANGSDTNNPNDWYYRHSLEAWKSTDNGATWSAVDYANHPAFSNSERYLSGVTIVLVGSLVYCFVDQQSFVTTPLGGGLYQYDATSEMSYVILDLSTDTWGSIVGGGPSYSATDTSSSLPIIGCEQLTLDCCLRGADEVVILYRDPSEPLRTDVRATNYLIFNTTSNTWGSGTEVFNDGSTADPLGNIVSDGTYLHFFSRRGYVLSGTTVSLLHRSLSSSNVLGTVTDIMDDWPGGLRARADQINAESDVYWAVFGGELIGVTQYYGSTPFATPYRKLVSFRATAAANPTGWTIEETGGDVWDASYTNFGSSGSPILVEINSTLYLVYEGDIDGGFGQTPSHNDQYLIRQTYSGGTWGTPDIWWSYYEAYSAEPSFTSSGANIQHMTTAVLNGSGFEKMALFGSWNTPDNWPLAEGDGMFMFRPYVENPCCCADFAY